MREATKIAMYQSTSPETAVMLTHEIECVLQRNQNEPYLRALLTRALILEKLYA